jgi:hypothetical protein
MSSPSAHAAEDPRFRWLPAPLRPLLREPPGAGTVRLVETTLLVIAAVFLATATIDDVVREVGVDHRLAADVRTWRTATHHVFHNLTVDQHLLGERSQREVVCGNTRPGPPKSSRQLCLEIWGPVRAGRRQVHGGWYIPAGSEDVRSLRFGCFGRAVAEGLCPP